uniref:GB1/RHD3-type G domain-containing protein n=1 Tax=Strigamia maritima TaxID=126957 RepID=T1JAA3_STRMM
MSNWEKPRLWIESREDDSLNVVPETAFLLQQITQPVVVVAVAGLYRTGKSYIMNRLANQKLGFDLGPTVQAQTKGIWIWCLTHPVRHNHCLVLIDTEGLSDPEKGNEKNDVSIFSLAVLLSSTFIFNILGKLDQKMIDDLYLVTQLTENIKVKSNQKESEDSNLNDFTEFLPAFVVAVRDFTLDLRLDGRPVSANDYFNHILNLKPGEGRKAFDYNLPRQAIRNAFKSHYCFTFTRPVQDEKMFSLLADNQLSEADLSPEFMRQSNEFCHYIYSTSSTKTLKRGQTVNGRVLSTLATEYVHAINSGAVPCIESTVTRVAERENDRVIEESIGHYETVMNALELPVDVAEIECKHKLGSKKATDHFKAHVIFDDNSSFLKTFVNKITNRFEQILNQNAEVSVVKCTEIINQLHEKIIVDKINRKEYARAGGYEEYCADVTRLLDEYNNAPAKGVKSDEVCHKFLKEKDAERNVIMHADKQMSEKDKEHEKIMNEKKMVEMEKLAADEEIGALKSHNEMLQKDYEEQMKKVKEEFEKQQHERNIEMEDLIEKRLEEKERLLREGFEKKANAMNEEIESLKKQKRGKSFIMDLIDGVERVVGMAPQLIMVKKAFKSKTPK